MCINIYLNSCFVFVFLVNAATFWQSAVSPVPTLQRCGQLPNSTARGLQAHQGLTPVPRPAAPGGFLCTHTSEDLQDKYLPLYHCWHFWDQTGKMQELLRVYPSGWKLPMFTYHRHSWEFLEGTGNNTFFALSPTTFTVESAWLGAF